LKIFEEGEFREDLGDCEENNVCDVCNKHYKHLLKHYGVIYSLDIIKEIKFRKKIKRCLNGI
jgi:DNA-directed RNA polymerase beta' subunit